MCFNMVKKDVVITTKHREVNAYRPFNTRNEPSPWPTATVEPSAAKATERTVTSNEVLAIILRLVISHNLNITHLTSKKT